MQRCRLLRSEGHTVSVPRRDDDLRRVFGESLGDRDRGNGSVRVDGRFCVDMMCCVHACLLSGSCNDLEANRLFADERVTP